MKPDHLTKAKREQDMLNRAVGALVLVALVGYCAMRSGDAAEPLRGQAEALPQRPALRPQIAPAPGQTVVQQPQLGAGLALTSAAAPVNKGRGPYVYVSCAKDESAHVHFGLAVAPDPPAPLRGVFGTVTIDGASTRLEMSGNQDGGWSPREMPEADARRLALAIARGRSVRLDGLRPYGATPVGWTIELPAAERRRFIAACEGTRTTPSPPAAETPQSRAIKALRLERARAYNQRARETNARREAACRGHVEAGGDPAQCHPPLELLPVS